MPLTRIKSLGITDGTIVNADINASAGIVGTKLGTGAVLQVVTATDSTQRTTTSGSFVTASNTLSVSITPSSASNKILILMTSGGGNNGTGTASYTVFRGATNLGDGSNGFLSIQSNGGQIQSQVAVNFLDSPSTTSSTTYQVQFRASANTATLNLNNNPGSITVMEIKG